MTIKKQHPRFLLNLNQRQNLIFQ